MNNDRPIGRLGRQSASEIADRAARIVVDASTPRALCLAPDGSVTVESVKQAIPDDIVGVYTGAPGLMGLWRLMYDDLRVAISERRIQAVPRLRVESGRRGKRCHVEAA